MAHWIKVAKRPKSLKFKCSKCGKICDCIKYVKHKTVCDYKYCPYCREPMESEVKRMKVVLDKGAFMPERAHKTDAGMDLRSPVNMYIPPRDNVTINTGVHIELPVGTVGMLKSKSGLNVKHDITSEGVIDVGYTGSIVVKLYNHGNTPYEIKRGDKITQLVVMPICTFEVEEVESLEKTERGDNGFGSTGR